MTRYRIVAGVTLLVALSWAQVASASGITTARFGGEHGHPMTTNPTAIYYNPAGIAASEGTQIFGDLTLAWRHARYTRPAAPTDVPPPPGAEGANVGTASLFNVLTSPMAGATMKVGSFAVGLAAFVPYGAQSMWSKNDAFEGDPRFPGAVDGRQRWFAIDGELISTYYSLAVGYQLDRLSFGVSANMVYSTVDTVRARTPLGNDDITQEGRAWVDASAVHLSLGAGVLYEALPEKLWLGFSFQSRPGFSGRMRLRGTLRTVFPVGGEGETPVHFHTDAPEVFRAGARFRPTPQTEFRLFGDYQRWSVLRNHCVSLADTPCEVGPDGGSLPGSVVLLNQRRNWRDTFGVRAGASLWLRPDVELMAGVGYSSNAIPSRTLDAALLDFDTVSLAFGGRFEILEQLYLMTTYTQFFAFSRDNTSRSIHPTLTGPTGVGSPSLNPDSGGRYSQWLGALNVNVHWIF